MSRKLLLLVLFIFRVRYFPPFDYKQPLLFVEVRRVSKKNYWGNKRKLRLAPRLHQFLFSMIFFRLARKGGTARVLRTIVVAWRKYTFFPFLSNQRNALFSWWNIVFHYPQFSSLERTSINLRKPSWFSRFNKTNRLNLASLALTWICFPFEIF